MSEHSESVGDAVGKTVENIVTNTESSAKAAVEEAQRKTDEATKAAESLAHAALNTELGHRIATQEEKSVKWLEEHEANKQAIAAVQATQLTLAESLNQLSSSLQKLTQPPPQQTNIAVAPPEASDITKTEVSEKDGDQTKPKARQRLFL